MTNYLNAVKEQLKDWRIAVLVLVFTVGRIVYGWAWLKSGIGKLAWFSDGTINSAGKIQVMIANIAGPEVSRFDPLMINKGFAWIANNIFLSMPQVTDALVVILEIGAGLMIILGFKVFWAALAMMFMNLQFFAGASFNNFGYVWTNLALLKFAKYAELLGIEGFLHYQKTNSLEQRLEANPKAAISPVSK